MSANSVPDEQLSAADKARREAAEHQLRDSEGHFIKSGSSTKSNPLPSLFNTKEPMASPSSSRSKEDPPLVSLRITNPITYLKSWWKKVMANEGIDLHLKVRPFTAIAMVALLGGGSFALGRISLPASSPIVKYVPQLAPSPSPNPWRETAYTGVVRQSGTRYYLTTAESEAITLEAPANVNLPKLLNRRILAVGKYNSLTKVLQITDASDLEVLPAQIVPVPTTAPSPTPNLPPSSVPTL